MRTQFSGLEMMRRALFANQRALDLVGQNISNANTRGYSRQDLSLYAAPPFHTPLGQGVGQIGAGVTDAGLVRYREEFFDRQFRQRSADLGFAGTWERVLTQMEEVLGAGEGDMAHAMNQLWASLQGLAVRPDQADARQAVRQAAEALVTRAQSLFSDLQRLQRSLDDDLALKADRINQIAGQIAGLNQEILRASGQPGEAPNALLDKRDLLLDELARLAGAQWQTASNGQVIVSIGSTVLVMGNDVNRIQVAKPGSAGLSSFTWEKGGLAVTFPGGELGGAQQARDSGVPEFMRHLQTLMTALVTRFNAVQAGGYHAPGASGPPFFAFAPDAADPALVDIASVRVSVDPSQIAAAAGAAAAPLDGENARALAAIFDDETLITDPVTGSGPVGLLTFNRAVMGRLGLLAERQRTARDVAALQQKQAENMRQTVSGVSLDEEMTKMIQFQHAYAAASRMVTAMDEALDMIVNRMGLVGR